MTRLRNVPIFLAAWLGGFIAIAVAEELKPQSPSANAEGDEFFERQIRPLLLGKCAECHGDKKQESGLRLDIRDAVTRGGDSGPVIVVGDPQKSRLIQAVRYDEDMQMPPDGKLTEAEIAALTEWVSRGAPWPQSKEHDSAESHSETDWQVARQHWAFQPVLPQLIPPVQKESWPQAPIDFFILAKLEERGIVPSELADRRTLIRRVTYDLTGLSPTYEEVEAFTKNSAPEAYAQLVDRLLASPRYGERWGRHWLDVARYADTKGYVGVDKGDVERREYPFAYSYRDWVIKSINDDLPFDQFLIQQIAADRLPLGEDKAALAALGFFRVGRVFLNNRHDQIDDKIDALMRGTQGLTVSCARCHDHKFDPIPTADYYSLYGVFNGTDEPDDADRKWMLLADKQDAHDARILKRGNPASPGDVVPRQFLKVLSHEQRKPFHDGSGRLELASAIASKENPLTARVFVNRIWTHHFGTSLVDSTSDFGVRTARPEYVALLDHLADRFMAEGWSTKRLHRWIVLSSTYQQTSQTRPEVAELDPENRLYWRFNRRRLDFEQMRDALLAASSELDLTMGGPSVEITTTPFTLKRTVYARVDRQNLPGVFRTFDFANPDTHSPGRLETTVPQQGLFVMNHPFVIERAQGVAKRLETEGIAGNRAKVERLYQYVLVRSPQEGELEDALAFVDADKVDAASPLNVWTRLAQALFLTNEFMFVD